MTRKGRPIEGLECFWCEPRDLARALEHPPVVGSSYTISLSPNQHPEKSEIWLTYRAPIAYYNGFETLDDLASLSFVRGVLQSGPSGQSDLVVFHPEEVRKLTDVEALPADTQSLSGAFEGAYQGVYQMHVMALGDYLCWDYSSQSNWGGSAIFRRMPYGLHLLYHSEFLATSFDRFTAGCVKVSIGFERFLSRELDRCLGVKAT